MKNRTEEKKSLERRIVPGHGRPWPADNNFLPSLPHFLYYEKHVGPNVELYSNPEILNNNKL